MDSDQIEFEINQVLQQSPPDVTYDKVKEVYYSTGKNISQAIAELWNLPSLPEKPKKTGVNADKWDEVRQICDEFDAEATKALHDSLEHNRKMTQQQQSQKISISEFVDSSKNHTVQPNITKQTT